MYQQPIPINHAILPSEKQADSNDKKRSKTMGHK